MDIDRQLCHQKVVYCFCFLTCTHVKIVYTYFFLQSECHGPKAYEDDTCRGSTPSRDHG